MKKTIIVLFVCFLTVPWILWYGIGAVAPSLQKSLSFDLNENRNIYDLEDGIENAYNDRVPFRTALIRTYNQVLNKTDEKYKASLEKRLIALLHHEQKQAAEMGKEISGLEWLIYGDDVFQAEDHIHEFYEIQTVEPTDEEYGYTLKVCNICGKEVKTDFVAKKVDSSYYPPALNDNQIMLGRNDWLYVFETRNWCKLYTGEVQFEEKDLEYRADVIQQIQDKCDENGIRFTYMIVPGKYQVYPEYLQTLDVVDSYKPSQRIADYISEHTSVKVSFPLDELSLASKYYQTYYRYDSHWNQVGAYVGTEVLYHNLGLSVTPLNDMEISLDESRETDWMDLIPMSGLERDNFTHADYDYDVVYNTDVKVQNSSGKPVFETTTGKKMEVYPVEEFTSDAERDGHIVFIGDSFRVMPMYYIAKDFKRSSFIHMYSFDGESYLGNYGLDYDEVLKQISDDLADADYLVFEISEGYEFMATDYQRVLLNYLP